MAHWSMNSTYLWFLKLLIPRLEETCNPWIPGGDKAHRLSYIVDFPGVWYSQVAEHCHCHDIIIHSVEIRFRYWCSFSLPWDCYLCPWVLCWNKDLRPCSLRWTPQTPKARFEWLLLWGSDLLLQAHDGIKGIVSNNAGEPIPNAEIKVMDLSTGKPIEHDVLSCKKKWLFGCGFDYSRDCLCQRVREWAFVAGRGRGWWRDKGNGAQRASRG